jgi:hypothetical protein
VEVCGRSGDSRESDVFFFRNEPSSINGTASINVGRGGPFVCGLGVHNSLNDNFAINVLTLFPSPEKKGLACDKNQNRN